MNLKTKSILFLFVALALFSFQKDFALAGFGISPPSVINYDLVPGSTYNQDINLVQGTPDADLNVVVTVDAGELNNWIKIGNGNSFVITKGTLQYPMKVTINVPSDAKFGEYKGVINAKTSPAGIQKDGVSVNVGANIKVDLKVSSVKVSNFSIQNFQISDVMKGSPIKLAVKVKNDGNVENGPTKVSLTFFDQYHSKQLGQQEVFVTEKAKAFETKDISVEFMNSLEAGSYWADVKIYSEDKTVVDSKVVFAVTSGAVAVSKDEAKSNDLVWVYALVSIVIILGVLFFKKRK